MRRTVTTTVALAAATALAAVSVPAAAAPNSRGATEIVPNDTLASLLVGVEKPFTDRDGDRAPEFGIVGNPSSGLVKHVGGITIDTPASGELTLRNFWIDLDAGTVSADVSTADASLGRLDLFELDGLTLVLNDTASTAIAGSTALSGAPVATADTSYWNF